ncbi:MAG: VOC family protein [Cellvibrionaceae bacterium]
MPATAFQRIRISCPSLPEAVAAYQHLLGFAPIWQGQVKSADSSEFSSSAWFLVNNTILELLPRDDQDAAVCGLVFRSDEVNATDDIVYRSDDGNEHVGTEQRVDKSSAMGLWLTLESEANSMALLGDSSRSLDESAIQSVDHVVLYTNDADGCVQTFGEQGLGLRLALDKTVPEWGGRMLFFRQGKLTLEIIQPNERFDGDDYFWGLAYQVTNIDAVVARLQNQGVTTSSVRDGRKPGTKVATVKSHHLNIPTLLVEPAIKR